MCDNKKMEMRKATSQKWLVRYSDIHQIQICLLLSFITFLSICSSSSRETFYGKSNELSMLCASSEINLKTKEFNKF